MWFALCTFHALGLEKKCRVPLPLLLSLLLLLMTFIAWTTSHHSREMYIPHDIYLLALPLHARKTDGRRVIHEARPYFPIIYFVPYVILQYCCTVHKQYWYVTTSRIIFYTLLYTSIT